MSDKTKETQPVSVTTNPADATGLQDGVADMIVDFELEQPGGTVKIPQLRRKKRVVFKY